jgi:hypothetical protein
VFVGTKRVASGTQESLKMKKEFTWDISTTKKMQPVFTTRTQLSYLENLQD